MLVGLKIHEAFGSFEISSRRKLPTLCLQETCLKVHAFESCKFKLRFVNCLAMGNEGRVGELRCYGGGIAMLWGRDINLSILSYSKFHIDMRIKEDGSRTMQYFIIGIYGHPDSSQRHRSWDLILLLILL